MTGKDGTVTRAVGRLGRWRVIGASSHDRLAELCDEVAGLREENARLRLDRERSVGLRRAAETAKQIANGEPLVPPPPPPDDGWEMLVEARVVRNELLFLCQDLRRALSFVERQLETRAPAAELDRRVNDRRDELGQMVTPRASLLDERADLEQAEKEFSS